MPYKKQSNESNNNACNASQNSDLTFIGKQLEKLIGNPQTVSQITRTLYLQSEISEARHWSCLKVSAVDLIQASKLSNFRKFLLWLTVQEIVLWFADEKLDDDEKN
ncbi:hypothetical protein F0562_008031 [Nyssa sinensis]|uniref:Uncharacterized protein n=1 Tax=Nyssa sinensis TaxID=561372 RepID=A0A5J5A6Z3_9ASTE|nr:hypothetical protein F0562_008031 [Nyssa sinensis]